MGRTVLGPGAGWPLLVAAMAVTVLAGATAMAAKPGGKPTRPPSAQGSFTDGFDFLDTTRWIAADGWTNGAPFDNGWRADHATVADGFLDLKLSDTPTLGEPYASGELRTSGYYGYGCYEAGFRPATGAGAVSSFFTFAGPHDNGGNGRHNEIDIEFLGGDTTRVQLNFWTNDDTYSSRNEVLLDLGFDAAAGLHAYGFKWTSTGIAWYVDGNLVHQAFDSPSNPTPKATESLQKIMMNLWPVDGTASGWAGTFAYPGAPLHARYDWVRYTAGENCAVTGEPPPPPPPPGDGDASTLHVADLSLALNSQATQVIARATVVDGLGRPAGAATVTGSWSGVIGTGDLSRQTGADGAATFYSGRSKNPGLVQFCVTGITRAGATYDPTANLETCDLIVK